MCAITGIVDHQRHVSAAVLERMRDTMVHRGPDGAGLWVSEDQRVGLAHRRLSIIDLSPNGSQPMIDELTGSALVFNGEIYNFQDLRKELEQHGCVFRSQSDTEVILLAYRKWGRDCLQKLKGMFAFALWDAQRGCLLLARDRAGEKPLFYRLLGDRFIFGSELKALFQFPGCDRRLDLESLLFYFSMGYVPGEKCLLQGFAKLPAASWLEVRFEGESLKLAKGSYWTLPVAAATESRDEVQGLEQRLEESVVRQMISDVPLGILLSGGVDSSLVAALARKHSTGRIKTFTVRFPGHKAHDETAHARLVAQHLETEHYELEAAPASVDLLPRLAWHFDEPLVDSSMIPTYLVSKLVREHCTVALGGDGGDELFGGYTHYRRLQKMAARLSAIPLPLRRGARAVLNATYPVTGRGRNWIPVIGCDFKSELPQVGCYYDSKRRQRVFNPSLLNRVAAPHAPEHYFANLAKGSTLLRRATATDFRLYLCEDILVKVDRSSMANSLEMRAPFLYPDLIEFAFGLPDKWRAVENELKVLPKLLCKKLLPPEFNVTRKQGFSLPLAEWLKGEFGQYFRSVLSEADTELFNRNFLLDVLERKHTFNTERLFGAVLFELWRREFKISLP